MKCESVGVSWGRFLELYIEPQMDSLPGAQLRN